MKRNLSKLNLFAATAIIAFFALVGCVKPKARLVAPLQGGEYLFVLNHDGSEASSNAVREAVNKTLSSDFGLPSKFVFLDHDGVTIALVSMPSLVLDTPQARQLKLGPAAGKLKAMVLAGGSGTKQVIDPWEIRAAAQAVNLEGSSNSAVFFIGSVSTNSGQRPETKSPSRIPAYWLDYGLQSADSRRLGIEALNEAGFDVVAYHKDAPLFWESVLTKATQPASKSVGGVPTLAGRPSKTPSLPQIVPASPDQPREKDARNRDGSPAEPKTSVRTASSTLPPPKAVVAAEGPARIPSPGVTTLATPGREKAPNPRGTALAPAALPVEPTTAAKTSTERSPVAVTSATPASVPEPPALRAPIGPVVPASAPLPIGSPDRIVTHSAPIRQLTADELKSRLDGFNVDGKHIMDTLPASFVAIKYTHAEATDPIALGLNQLEKREFNFPGAGAGTTRLVSKVAGKDSVDALECYGFDDTAKGSVDNLLVTIMRRVEAQEKSAKDVEVIARRGTKIKTQIVTVPPGIGLYLPLKELLN